MKTTDKLVLFWTGTFSNWHNSTFVDPLTKLVFESSEEAFFWYKADFFKDLVIRAILENNVGPREAKKLGREIKNFNDDAWDMVKDGFMVYVNYLKYSQNPSMKQELLDTGDKILVEASPYDRIWGIGLDEEDPRAINPFEWQGENRLGAALMNVRKKLQAT